MSEVFDKDMEASVNVQDEIKRTRDRNARRSLGL